MAVGKAVRGCTNWQLTKDIWVVKNGLCIILFHLINISNESIK
jgi:hypothetical protein